MQIQKWFSDGHPLRYHLAALGLAVVALGAVVTTTILADDGGTTTPITTTTTATTTVTTPQCSYSYSVWGACQSNGSQKREVLSRAPSGCEEYTHPVVEQHCTYTAPTTSGTTSGTTSTGTATNTETITSCSYTYGNWSICQSDGKRYRPIVSTAPSGCVTKTSPQIAESCTFIAVSNTQTTASSPTSSQTSTTTTSANQCLYTYTNWGTCQSNGKRTRLSIEKSPSGCEEYTHPILEQSCVYDGSSTVSSGSAIPVTTQSTSVTTDTTHQGEVTSGVTPPFSFTNVGEGMIIRETLSLQGSVSGAQGVEYYLVPVGSNTYKYIGNARVNESAVWSLNFRSGDFPNGEFYLRAKIKNMYGEYGSGQRKISIANDGQPTGEGSKVEKGFTSFEVTNTAKVEALKQAAQDLGVPKDETIASATTDPNAEKKHIFDYCQAHSDKCFPERDSDHDGLSDVDEVRYGTNPKSADSDLDGFLDGDEVKGGFDPLKYSAGDQSDRIVFESPKVSGEIKKEVYTVKNVSLQGAESKEQKIHLSGKGLPNSFVTIYVYSDPIVLTVKTDSEGNWTYELDKELEDGKHEAYVAVTDNTGKITAKSEPLLFVKTAQAVTVIPEANAAEEAQTLPVSENRAQKDILLLVAIIIAAVAVALATVGLIKHRHALAKEGPSQP